MENSEVLNQELPKDGKEQQDVAPINSEAAPAVLEEATISPIPAATQLIGERDHATDISRNITYNYNSEKPKEYDDSITTTTTPSTGKKPTSTTWQSKYEMSDDYKVDDSQDYSWNKMAEDMAQLDYDQRANQYRAESIAAKQELDAAASSAWNNYFAAEYSARQTQDKMGWSGGQQQASDLQVKFLQAESAANMYTQTEMQKYGVESKLSIARMYADANQKALALEYYQDAVNKAIQEANITGCYVPPEASEMFIQEDLARDILNNPSSTQDAKDRAEKIIKNCEAYYRNLGFEEWTTLDENGNVVTEFRGIKTLNYLQHKETERNNRINEELQRQANEINDRQADIAAGQLALAELEYEYTIENTNRIETDKIFEKGVSTILPQDGIKRHYVDGNGKKHEVYNGDQVYIYNNSIRIYKDGRFYNVIDE